MATTAPARPGAAPAVAGRGRLPAPVRDRRPALAALALLLVLGGALASALVAYRSGERIDVLVAARDIAVGEQIEQSDFRVARVASDGAAFVEAQAAGNFVGARASTTVPEGTLVNRTMFLSGSVVPADATVVGVVLGATQRPAEPLQPGDVVRVFSVPRDGQVGVAGVELVPAVRVAEVGGLDGGGSLGLSLLVPPDRAPALVAAASTGQVAVARLAPDTDPAVDFAQE